MIHGCKKTIGTIAAVKPVSYLLTGNSEMSGYACVDKILSSVGSPGFARFLIEPGADASFLNDLASAPAAGQIIVRWGRACKRSVYALFDCSPVPILF